ncbi:MAG: thioredoxin family protein [Anaerolineae bacterium]
MTKSKNQIPNRTLDKRLIVGIIVGLVVVTVIAVKVVVEQRSSSGAVASTNPTNVSASATTSQSESDPDDCEVCGPNKHKPTVTPTSQVESDPYPTSPGLQVAWVYRNNKPAMILYHSTNCIPCIAMDELVKKVHADYEPGVVFIHVITNDASNMTEIRRSGIRFIPTSFFVSVTGENNVVVGAMEEEALREELSRLQAGN